MSEEKHIELNILNVSDETVTFKIAKQTHFRKDFCQRGFIFEASNGIKLMSDCYESQILDIFNEITLRVLPVPDEQYNKNVIVSIKTFAKIMEAISEYNETNGIGYKNMNDDYSWPKIGDYYLYISSDGYIKDQKYEYGNHVDEKRFLLVTFSAQKKVPRKC